MVAMMNLKGDPYIRGVLSGISSFFNKICGADFRLQAFPVPFKNMARGMDLVIFEEFPTGELARHLSRDLAKRNETLKSPEYRKKFKKHYANKLAPKVWQKDFGDAFVVDAPDKSWIGKSFTDLASERGQHPVDTFLDVVVDLDKEVLWETTIGNPEPLKFKKLYNDPNGILGFADSGAHIDNMAFYNFPIRTIKYVKDSHERGEPFMSYEKIIWRLTKENADFFNIDAGTIEVGKRAESHPVHDRHAEIEMTFCAKTAVQTGSRMERHHRIANLKVNDSLPHLVDDATHFVTHFKWEWKLGMTSTEGLQIGSAGEGGLNFDHNFTGTSLRNRLFPHL